MKEKVKAYKGEIIVVSLSSACLIISMFFLNLSGFNFESFLLADLYAITAVLLSPLFWLFIVFFVLANSLLIYLLQSKNSVISLALCIFSVSFSLLLSFFLFAPLRKLVFLIPFYIIGLAVSGEILKTKLSELKRFKTIRSTSAAVSKLILLISLGLFVSGFLVVMPEKELYAEMFEKTFVKSFIKVALNSVSDAVVEEKRELMREILDSKEFKALESADCEESRKFSLYFRNLAQEIHSEKYRKDALKDVAETIEDEKFLEKASEHVPLKAITRGFTHFILPFNTAFLFYVFGQIFINIPCALLSTIFIKMRWE
ncbi:MAG: hypothetical protein QXM75_00615 [Candidatus Diapherotrites archaeon]